MGKVSKKPDWAKWGSMFEAFLTDAVALSCDVEPQAIIGLGAISDEDDKEMVRRMHIAKNHADGGRLSTFMREMPGMYAEAPVVQLADFARWAVGIGWTLPPQFPGATTPAAVGTAKTLTTKERDSLLSIVGALAELAGLDIKRPTTTAKAIVRKLDELGCKIGQRTVEEYLKAVEGALENKGY